MSKPRIECNKERINSKLAAERVAQGQSEKWGKPVRHYLCPDCASYHVTTNKNGRNSARKTKNAPETMRMQRKRYKNRQKLPIEIWEGEGGYIPGVTNTPD